MQCDTLKEILRLYLIPFSPFLVIRSAVIKKRHTQGAVDYIAYMLCLEYDSMRGIKKSSLQSIFVIIFITKNAFFVQRHCSVFNLGIVLRLTL